MGGLLEVSPFSHQRGLKYWKTYSGRFPRRSWIMTRKLHIALRLQFAGFPFDSNKCSFLSTYSFIQLTHNISINIKAIVEIPFSEKRWICWCFFHRCCDKSTTPSNPYSKNKDQRRGSNKWDRYIVEVMKVLELKSTTLSVNHQNNKFNFRTFNKAVEEATAFLDKQ